MEILLNLHFIRPWWLLALIPVLVVFLGLWQMRRSHKGWSQVIDEKLLPHLLVNPDSNRQGSPIQWVLLGWLLAVLALAGPAWQKIPQPVQKSETALVILLDLSPSMLVQDQAPSRLERARRKIRDLVKLRREGTTALIAYAGDAHVVSPLTDDMRTISNLVPALSPGMMPTAGSNASAAVDMALDLFFAGGQLEGNILLLTDGVREDRIRAIEKTLSDSNFRLSIIGLGTEEGGPIPSASGNFVKDKTGAIILAKKDRNTLMDLATAGGGFYRDISLDDSDLEGIATPAIDITDGMADTDSTSNTRFSDSWQDNGYWLVLLCLPLALAAFRRGWLMGVALLVTIPAQDASAFEWQDLWQTPDQQAAQALADGNADEAAELFEDSQWAASAHYKAKNYEEAEKGFSNQDNATGWYNRGNARAFSGDIEGAIEAYEEALALQPDFEDARFNKELLERMQNDQQQQQQNQDQDQNQQQNQEQNQDKDQNQEQEQNQDQQQDQEQDQNQQEDQEQENQEQDSQKQEEQEQPAEDPNDESQEEAENREEKSAETSPADPEDKATEQWLRQIPDDPAGLLRNKFRYESQIREQQAPRENLEDDW